MAQTYKQVYESYTHKLVKILPMDDVIFTANLITKHLLPGNIQNHIASLPTPADKSLYFLSHVIKPSLDIDITSSFDDLLDIMESCEYAHIEVLAREIKAEIAKKCPSVTSM